MMLQIKNKKVLIMGLGTLGGGIASAKWFLAHGARVTVTDLRTEKELKNSLKEFHCSKKEVSPEGAVTCHSTLGIIAFVLGKHRKEDFETNDSIVVNPAVRRESEYLKIAKMAGKEILNDARIFFDVVPNPVVAVTGTRGKTTTTNWIAYLLKSKYPNVMHGGNSSKMALLSLADTLSSSGRKEKKTPAVVELSSWQLELLDGASRGPDVAVITNIFPDHLNRYGNVRDYASAKANIFSKQTASQKLILNFDNPWTNFFLSKKPRSEVYFISLKKLPAGKNGLEILPTDEKIGTMKGGMKKVLSYGTAPEREVVFIFHGKKYAVCASKVVRKLEALGEHNMYNFLASALVAHFMGVSWATIEKRASTLPQIPLRQEVIITKDNTIVVNDSAGTSPDATIAAIRRFKHQGKVTLITGGTDKNLEFKSLAREVKKNIAPENLILLNGSATKKLIGELKKLKYFSNSHLTVYENLDEILKQVKKYELGIRNHESGKRRRGVVIHNSKLIILFSPGAASFEKFKNEFDRGEQFNAVVKKHFKGSASQ